MDPARLVYLANQIAKFFHAQGEAAESNRKGFQDVLAAGGYGEITTEVAPAGPFFYAEPYHQQYLAKNPGGYCGVDGTGVVCPIGTGVAA